MISFKLCPTTTHLVSDSGSDLTNVTNEMAPFQPYWQTFVKTKSAPVTEQNNSAGAEQRLYNRSLQNNRVRIVCARIMSCCDS